MGEGAQLLVLALAPQDLAGHSRGLGDLQPGDTCPGAGLWVPDRRLASPFPTCPARGASRSFWTFNPTPPTLYLGAWPQPLLPMAEQVYMKPLGSLHLGPQGLQEHPPAGRGHAQGVTAGSPSQLAPARGSKGAWDRAVARSPGAGPKGARRLGSRARLPSSLRQGPGCWHWMCFCCCFY